MRKLKFRVEILCYVDSKVHAMNENVNEKKEMIYNFLIRQQELAGKM